MQILAFLIFQQNNVFLKKSYSFYLISKQLPLEFIQNIKFKSGQKIQRQSAPTCFWQLSLVYSDKHCLNLSSKTNQVLIFYFMTLTKFLFTATLFLYWFCSYNILKFPKYFILFLSIIKTPTFKYGYIVPEVMQMDAIETIIKLPLIIKIYI